MLWVIVRFIEVPCRRRYPLYVALLAARLPDVMGEGTAYTPVRMIGAAFFLIMVALIWRRTGSAFLTSVAAWGSIVIELGISPEQGIGVAVGLSMWLLILAWKGLFPWRALGVFVAALVLLFGIVLRSGLLNTLKSFAGGAYGLPLVPSVPVALILLAYVVAFSAAMHQGLRGETTNTSVPMVLGGLALLPVAFGRCDLGHLELASGALLIGIASIESYPKLRRWWSPLALLYFVLLPAFFIVRASLPMSISGRLHLTKPEPRLADLQTLNPPPPRPGGEPGGPLPLKAPCAVVYRVVNVWPDYTHLASGNCLETGYYISDQNFFTDAAVERRIEELATHAKQPLLLPDVPLDRLMTAFDIDPTVMKPLVRALYVPRLKNRPFSYQALTDYIQVHYVPASEPTGSYRVWYPKVDLAGLLGCSSEPCTTSTKSNEQNARR